MEGSKDKTDERIQALTRIFEKRNEISELDGRICDLVLKRADVLEELESDSASICIDANVIGEDEKLLSEDWLKNKFDGEVVKRSVKFVRSVFFDDTLEKFREFDCSDIEFTTKTRVKNHFFGGVDYEFTNGKDTFSIWIPVSAPSSQFDGDGKWGYSYYPFSNESEFSEYKWMGKIKIRVVTNGKEFLETYFSSLDIYEVKRKLAELIDDFGKEKDRITKNIDEYLYKVYENWYDSRSSQFGSRGDDGGFGLLEFCMNLSNENQKE